VPQRRPRPSPPLRHRLGVRFHASSLASLREGRATYNQDPFGARDSLGAGLPDLYRLTALDGQLDLGRTPVTLKVLLENVLRHAGEGVIDADDVTTLAGWRPGAGGEAEVPFMPARVILQDFTGVPAIVDLAAMRDAMADLG
jgi:aconitate hydratase